MCQQESASGELPALPEAFVERLRAIVPDDRFNDVLASFACAKPPALRINTLRAAAPAVREELASQGFDLRAVPWYDLAFTLPTEQRRGLTAADAFAEGRVYLQNLASMLAPLALAPQPGEAVLDLCAAPGGKTLQIAAMMDNRGALSAVEAIRPRMYRLQANLRTHGATMVKTYLTDGRTVGRKTPERFDRVLLDAPCSSEARFTLADPDSWQYWSERKIREMSRKQKGLLKAAIHAAQVGGTVLYCTCSFAPEENERVIDEALRRFAGAIRVEPLELPIANVQPGLTAWNGKPLHESLQHAVRVLPNDAMDAFFLCKMTKTTATSQPTHQKGRRT